MNDSEIRDYLVDIAERLEVLSNVLRLSGEVAIKARFNEPYRLKSMLDSIVCEELVVMSGIIIDDIKEL